MTVYILFLFVLPNDFVIQQFVYFLSFVCIENKSLFFFFYFQFSGCIYNRYTVSINSLPILIKDMTPSKSPVQLKLFNKILKDILGNLWHYIIQECKLSKVTFGKFVVWYVFKQRNSRDVRSGAGVQVGQWIVAWNKKLASQIWIPVVFVRFTLAQIPWGRY